MGPRRASGLDGRAGGEGGVVEGLGLAGVTENSRPAGQLDAVTTSGGQTRTIETSATASPSQRPIEDLATDIASTRVSLEAELQDLEATAEPDDPTIAELRRELDDLSTEVDRVTRQVENLNARRRELERQPVGAMLIIQGLAQTQIQSGNDDDEEGSAAAGGAGPGSSGRTASGAQTGASPRHAGNAAGGSSGNAGARGTGASAPPRRPTNFRRMSDGSLFRRRREEQEERGASVDQQARMIGGLLTSVFPAATAPPCYPATSRVYICGVIICIRGKELTMQSGSRSNGQHPPTTPCPTLPACSIRHGRCHRQPHQPSPAQSLSPAWHRARSGVVPTECGARREKGRIDG